MRTTITVDDRVLEAAKRRAVERGATLSAFIEDVLTTALGADAGPRTAKPFTLVTYRGDGPHAGLDLDVRPERSTLEDIQTLLGAPPAGPHTVEQLREGKIAAAARKAGRGRGR